MGKRFWFWIAALLFELLTWENSDMLLNTISCSQCKQMTCKRMRTRYSKPLKLLFALLACGDMGQSCTGTSGTPLQDHDCYADSLQINWCIGNEPTQASQLNLSDLIAPACSLSFYHCSSYGMNITISLKRLKLLLRQHWGCGSVGI